MNLIVPPTAQLGTFTDKLGNSFSLVPGGTISVTNKVDIEALFGLGCMPDPRGFTQPPYPLQYANPLASGLMFTMFF